METMRLILVLLHVLIVIFIIVNHHSDLSTLFITSNYRTKLVTFIVLICNLFRITLYHTASILAVWFSRQYGAGVVRASGILLLGELLQLMTWVIQQMFELEHITTSEIYFIGIYFILLLISVLITFRLSEKISKYQRQLMQVELLANRSEEIFGDDNNNNI